MVVEGLLLFKYCALLADIASMQSYLNCGQRYRLIPGTNSLPDADISQPSEGTDVPSLNSLCWHSVEVVVHKQLGNLASLWLF